MKKTSVLVLLLVLGISLLGCSAKKIVKTEPSSSMDTSQKLKNEAREVTPEEKITDEQIAKIETTDETMPIDIERKGIFEDIHFGFDNYYIQPDAKPTLRTVANWMSKNPVAKILIEGHCCELGTDEYNLALGDRRAKATRDYLVALGIASSRIEMISYGEERPLCTQSAAEDCLTKNRRAHFAVLKQVSFKE